MRGCQVKRTLIALVAAYVVGNYRPQHTTTPLFGTPDTRGR